MERRSLEGQFRVIGTDTFSWPHEDYWVGDYSDLLHAKELAHSRAQGMSPLAVYDEDGKLLFISGNDDVKA
jgi:hypothetical protein